MTRGIFVMPLVAAKCAECGANIEVDDTKEAGICKYCGTAFITEKAINNYNTYITNNNNFAGASIVLQGNIENIEKLIERATTFIKLNEYDSAEKLYHEISLKYPMDYRGWLGIVMSKTKEMTEVSHLDNYEKMIDYFDKAIKVAKPIEQEYILRQKDEYKLLYKKAEERNKDGYYIASVCNLYNYRDVEKALGCKCLSSESYTFEQFVFVIGNHVNCSVSYMGVGLKNGEWKAEHESKSITLTCEKYVTRDNIKNYY